jgi:hypothetical protein
MKEKEIKKLETGGECGMNGRRREWRMNVWR